MLIKLSFSIVKIFIILSIYFYSEIKLQFLTYVSIWTVHDTNWQIGANIMFEEIYLFF
jgi:hypothetical protein